MSPAKDSGVGPAVAEASAVDAADIEADRYLAVVASVINDSLRSGAVSLRPLLPVAEHLRAAFAAAGGDPGPAIESAERVLEELQRVVARSQHAAGRRLWANSLLNKLVAPRVEFDQALVAFKRQPELNVARAEARNARQQLNDAGEQLAEAIKVEIRQRIEAADEQVLALTAARWTAVAERATAAVQASALIDQQAESSRVEAARSELAQAEAMATAAAEVRARKTRARLQISDERDRAVEAHRQHKLNTKNATGGAK